LHGMPRRYAQFGEEFLLYNRFSTIGAFILGSGMFLVLAYLLHSLWYGAKAPMNPWGAATLEWRTSSPPHPHNFEEAPAVTGPYDFSVLQEISEEHGYVRNDGANP